MKKAYFHNKVPRSVWYHPLHIIAFGFGSGAVPVGPGTVGTLVAIPFYLLLRQLTIWPYIIVVLLLAILSIFLCDKVSRDIGVHDHPGMNIDEFIGFFVAMIAAPHAWQWVVIGFILFRFIDIVKPPPINWIDQHIGGGFGMIFDDILAGIFTMVIIQLLLLW